ncbi:hypothetical protein Amsp01_030710 [Amycolatopsis sp. NBRC 101858]|uniref:hypothetical protein n=1 Tax=Amycolatopsis sp. NBRC 101858 TaxID=3032200 RepID=UPI0024A2F9A7|nr:hypothetical protein [Amycolatopsis sp. NBRC 101858]GLY37047.1 hypothetical protein Amsp01_030710 [Amycolatopsis sp. NBRC 101858]
MADVSYTPVFHHTEWVDKVDRAEASGPNGFNIRFNAIERDLLEASTVVTEIATAIRTVRTSAPDAPARITFTPQLRDVPPALGFETTNAGFQSGLSNAQLGACAGVANFVPPDRARLSTVRVVGGIDASGTNTAAISVMRIPLLGATASATKLGGVSLTTVGDFDLQSPVSDDVALVDLSTFRYFVSVSYQCTASGRLQIQAVHLGFAPPA